MIIVSMLVVYRGCTDQSASVDRTSMGIGDGANLELVAMFCYLGDTLSVDGDADVAVEAMYARDEISLDNLPLYLPTRMSQSL